MPIVLAAWAGVLAASLGLQMLNRRHLATHCGRVPPELAGVVDAAALQRIAAYTGDKMRLAAARTVALNVVLAVFLFGGGLAAYDAWVAGIGLGFVASGVLFFLGLVGAETLLDVPFGLVRTFRIEARHGFNAVTRRLWMADALKTLLLAAVLTALLAAGALALVAAAPRIWWLAVWAFFAVVSVFLLYVSPYVLEPLFFKIEPVRAPDLEAGVRDLMQRAGLRVERLFQVDASRRSRHSNAYFTGIGPVKRIVLFDTLLSRMAPAEILAILAHEAGHWKLRHVQRRLIATEVLALGACALAFAGLRWGGLPGLVGMEGGSFAARVVVLAFVGSLLAFPLAPLANALSRRDEWQADRFAAALSGRPEDLARALAKLARDNLANLHPHPLYAWWFYSHPPSTARIRALTAAAPATGERAS